MKNLKIKVLERVIKHRIHGNTERADTLLEKYMTAVAAFIVNESELGDGDAMFPARRELQRELEADLELDRVDLEDESDLSDDLGTTDNVDGEIGGESEPESVEAVADMIAALMKSGDIDDEKLSQIVDIIAGGMDSEGEQEDVGGIDQDPADEIDPVGSDEYGADGELPNGIEPPAAIDPTEIK